jgi:hypothetical protein
MLESWDPWCLIRFDSREFFPTLSPTLSRPAGREREPTATFGRVLEVSEFNLNGQRTSSDKYQQSFKFVVSGYF